MPKETDPHINFQIPGDLSPQVVLRAHHAARIKRFGHENEKNQQSKASFSYESSCS